MKSLSGEGTSSKMRAMSFGIKSCGRRLNVSPLSSRSCIVVCKYTYILFHHPELDLETVYLLDQVQKGLGRSLSKAAIQHLRKHKLVEGRVSNLYLSAEVAQSISEEAQYIKNKGFDDQYYRDMIVDYLEKFGKAQRKDIRELLWDKLPGVLTDEQKERKILTLLTALKRKEKIKTDSDNKQKSCWVLTEKQS